MSVACLTRFAGAACICITVALAGCAQPGQDTTRKSTSSIKYAISDIEVQVADSFAAGLWPKQDGETDAQRKDRIADAVANRIEQRMGASAGNAKQVNVVAKLAFAQILVKDGGKDGSITSRIAGVGELLDANTGEQVAVVPIDAEHREHHMTGTFSLPGAGRLSRVVLNTQLEWLLDAFVERLYQGVAGG